MIVKNCRVLGWRCSLSSIFDLQIVVPPRAIRQFIYRCDRCFHLDTIIPLFESPSQNIGAIVCSGDEAFFYLVNQPDSSGYIKADQVARLTTYLPKGHRKGGQSAPRFQRLYLQELDAYLKKIVTLALELFRKQGNCFIKKLIVSGNGIRKTHLIEELKIYFKIELVEFNHLAIADLLKEPNLTQLIQEEKNLTTELKSRIATQPEYLVFGIEEVQRHLPQLKRIISTELIKVPEEKLTILNEPWLKMYGGVIGILHHKNDFSNLVD